MNFSADVHIMTFCPQTGFCHLLERVRERTSAVKHRIDILQGGIQFCSFMQRKSSIFKVVFSLLRGLGAQLLFVAPGENRMESLFQCEINDELTGVSV